jgi:hypothetical protein
VEKTAGWTPRASGRVMMSRRLVLGSTAAAAVLGMLPARALAFVIGDSAVEGSDWLENYEASSGDTDAGIDQLSADLVTAAGTPTTAQLSSDVALSRVTDAQLHWIDPPPGGLFVPYVSQYDGTPYQRSNCGPAALSMILGYLGALALPAAIRGDVIQAMGTRGTSVGASWDSLVAAAEKRGLRPFGLYDARRALRAWSIADLDAALGHGDPVLALVRFPLLPGRGAERFRGDHYIPVVGRANQGQYYFHDPACHDLTGAFRVITRAQLLTAWTQIATGLCRTGMLLMGHG